MMKMLGWKSGKNGDDVVIGFLLEGLMRSIMDLHSEFLNLSSRDSAMRVRGNLIDNLEKHNIAYPTQIIDKEAFLRVADYEIARAKAYTEEQQKDEKNRPQHGAIEAELKRSGLNLKSLTEEEYDRIAVKYVLHTLLAHSAVLGSVIEHTTIEKQMDDLKQTLIGSIEKSRWDQPGFKQTSQAELMQRVKLKSLEFFNMSVKVIDLDKK